MSEGKEARVIEGLDRMIATRRKWRANYPSVVGWEEEMRVLDAVARLIDEGRAPPPTQWDSFDAIYHQVFESLMDESDNSPDGPGHVTMDESDTMYEARQILDALRWKSVGILRWRGSD